MSHNKSRTSGPAFGVGRSTDVPVSPSGSAEDIDLGAVFGYDGRVTFWCDDDALAQHVVGGRVELTCRVEAGESGAVDGVGEGVFAASGGVGGELGLDQVLDFGVDDRLVGAGDVVLGDLAGVDPLGFGQEVNGE